ncbi:M3 family metallopeptidase [Reichenbachiella sp. MALMAid0571]|uniref:M3 family metallopeptidase n=1 Tax=Reichenbachiella sp. MALMAid0571 TaxID=3143939 RepID=UPI0032DF2EF9
MKQLITLMVCSLILACQPQQQKEVVTVPDNPFFNTFNEEIDFGSIEANHVTEATTYIQEQTDAAIAKVIDIEEEDRTFDNTMLALDDLHANLDGIASAIYLMSYTHPDSVIRSNALKSNTILSQYTNKVELNEDLYKAVKSFSKSKKAEKLTGYKAKYLKETVEEFERSGFGLSKEDREVLKGINDQISEIGDKFSQNIASYKDFLIVSESDIEGLPEDYKESRKQKDGTYKVDLSYPSYRPFMKYCKSEKARKELYLKYMNRAYPDNIEVLQQLLQKRKEMAELLGYNSYASYVLEDRMAKNPESVWAFEGKLMEDLKSKEISDYQELLDIKKSKTGKSDVINSWESSFYFDKLLKEKYQLDGEEVKQYFSLDDVINGLFTITQTIFDLEYREVESPSVWQKDVRMFEVIKDGKLKGRFYLDLFPRENKYNHAACFGIKSGKMTTRGYQIPTASLVCNFPEPTADKPSLMPHSQVETFFHEFGHVLHQMVTTADLYSQSGTSVSRDFVEAPSQIFENWAWNYEALKLFAKHYETREVIPEALFNKMLAAKNVGSAIAASHQVFFGTYDMTLHDKYDPNGEESTTDVLKRVQEETTISPYVEGTHFQTSFGHLNGYGASYYGYLWSKVYAQDMFSVFEQNGVLDKKTGKRYRDIILASGSSKEEIELVKEFLGREPNNDAFLRELGL